MGFFFIVHRESPKPFTFNYKSCRFTPNMNQKTKSSLLRYTKGVSMKRVYSLFVYIYNQKKMIPAKKRFQVLQRDNFRCQYCGKNGKDVSLEVDHVIPKSKGGTDDLKNLITCCRECNIGKGNEIIGDTKGIIRMKIKDKESEIVKDFFSTWNDYGLGTIDSRNIAFISGFIKSYFDWDTVIGYVECCLVNKIGKITDHNKYQMEDFYKGGDDCQLAIDERGVFAWENDFERMIYSVKGGEEGDEDGENGRRLTDDYNKRLNWVISREIARIGKPMGLLYKYSLFPNMVEIWQKEKEEW